MTVKEARHRAIGEAVLYKGVVRGVITGLKADSMFIQWQDLPQALEIQHDQMEHIQLATAPAVKGRYDR